MQNLPNRLYKLPRGDGELNRKQAEIEQEAMKPGADQVAASEKVSGR
jgi:hypothetical protein